MHMFPRAIARLARIDIRAPLTVVMLALVLTFARPVHAMNIQEITSPGGIKAHSSGFTSTYSAQAPPRPQG